MQAKKIFVALLIIVVAIGGFVAGLFLLRERQNINEEAAVPTGQAEVSINPESGNFDVGDTIQASVTFNPANIAISGVAVRLAYPYTGNTPEVSVTSVSVNPTISSSSDWTCPTQSSNLQGGNVLIDIACANTSASGFSSNTDTLLANVTLKVDRQPSTSPFVVRFDPALSVITRKSDNQDILLIPTSTGSYSVGQVQVTPTTKLGTPTPTAKVTGTKTPTPTKTATSSGTPTPTTSQLPDAGVSYPTIFGVGLGVLVIVGAMLLAI